MQYVPHMPQPRAGQPSPRPTARAAAQRQRCARIWRRRRCDLFATKGYEATTVDEIAATAGVARRTFFRHFRSKEEAIFPDHDDTLVRVQAVLDSAEPHEHPLDTVCRGITEVLRMYAESPQVSVERYRLTREVPTLREREIASVARYERLFTRYLLGHFDEAAHRDGDDDPLLAEVAASAVVAAHNHVLRRWLRAGGKGDVEAQLDHAFDVIRETFGTGIGHRAHAAAAGRPDLRRGGARQRRGGGRGGPYRRLARRGAACRRARAQGGLTPPRRHRVPRAHPVRPVQITAVPVLRGRPCCTRVTLGEKCLARSVFTTGTACHKRGAQSGRATCATPPYAGCPHSARTPASQAFTAPPRRGRTVPPNRRHASHRRTVHASPSSVRHDASPEAPP